LIKIKSILYIEAPVDNETFVVWVYYTSYLN